MSKILNGFLNQIGREYGRAFANKSLKGSNYYNIKQNGGNINNDKFKENLDVKINNIKFGSTDKTNLNKLNELLDFKNVIINSSFEEFLYISNILEEKLNYGFSLIKDRNSETYKIIENKYNNLKNDFNIKNINSIEEIKKGKIDSVKRRKNKWIIFFIAIFTIGIFDWLYVKDIKNFIIYLIIAIIGISGLFPILLINFF
ncbi:MAG: hypothetical protein ACOCP8_08920, partial [archaeon]